MPHDKRGEELKVGDTVMVPCTVKAIHLTEDYCNVDLVTKLTMPPQETTQTLTLNSRQTIKPTATHRFAEYGADTEGDQPHPIMVDRDADLRIEMRAYLDTLRITGHNIGDIRRSLFVPWDSLWNGWVRDETAARESRGDTEGDASPAPSICPSHICPVCYHEKDRCSHCDTMRPALHYCWTCKGPCRIVPLPNPPVQP
jgi:hypothetical protein